MTLIERLEKAGEGSLADLIDRLTLYEHREGYDGKDWEKIASEAAEAIRALHADKAMLTGQLQASRAMLAASPSVGGWEDISTAPKDGADSFLLFYDGKKVRPVREGFYRRAIERFGFYGSTTHGEEKFQPTHWMPLPPPPSVSTGSRPQEAVPTEQAAPTVVSGWDREICTGCTASLSIADIKARGIVSCCPDRHMVRIGDLVDAYTARPPTILPQTEKGS